MARQRGRIEQLAHDVHLSFRPWPKQAAALYPPIRYKAWGGGRGGGKSATGAGKAWDLLVSYPGNVGFMGRADLEDLRRSMLKEFFAQDERQGLIIQHHQTQMWIDVRTSDPEHPSRLYYGELKDPNSQLGVNLGFAIIDEGYEIPRMSFDNLAGNMRHRLPDGSFPPFLLALTTNPWPCWIMDLFPVTLAQQAMVRRGEWEFSDYGYFPFLATDNPANPPEYVEQLKQIYKDDPVLYNRMILGLWDNMMQGLVYPFQPYHRWKAPPGTGGRLYRPGVPVSLAIDPSGGTAPYACLALQQVGRYVLVVDCFYKKGALDEHLVDWLHSRPYADNLAMGVCDPAAKASIMRLQAAGVPVMGMSYPKDIPGQILGVKGIMAQDPANGFAPLLIDENHALDLCNEMAVYSYKKLRDAEIAEGKLAPERPEDKNNHAINALEYWVREKRPTGAAGGFRRKDPESREAAYYGLLSEG